MATISENLQTIKDSTDAIKQAIIDKGGTIEGDITTWASVINAIDTGGSGGPGSVFKITNKLNGQLFGGPTYTFAGGGDLLHNYTFEGGEVKSHTIISIQDPSENGTFPNSYVTSISANNAVGVKTSTSNTFNGYFDCYINKNYELRADGTGYNDSISSTSPLKCMYIAIDANDNYDFDFFYIQAAPTCILKDTLITLHDNSKKVIQDITYNDELLVWNFDEGKYDMAKPLWIKKTQMSSYYYRCELDNGTILNLVGSNGKCHRLFSIKDGMFLSATDMVGKAIYTENGVAKVISCERVEKEVEFYNIITDYHMNLFANGVLTSCRYNNIYPIQDMKFVKDDRLNRAPRWKLYESFRDHRSLDRFINGLRLYEQLDIPLEDTIKYCERLESLRKTLDEFEGNEDIIYDIENTEVGWIDRKGKAYGFKTYMPGQNNHIILADKICQILDIKTDNTSRYLEKLGWVKYTTDFILNSDDEYINKKQLNTIKKFLNVPGKCKKEGFIKIGTAFDDYTSISDFENMDEYSFEFRKRNNRKIWQQDK